ncbi:E3 ubiquitin-protein ligase RBBP6 [Rhynchospora pubera]|uniref:E3 ubiquitin-protein ligase RBBP6 n=1 Tax=Rhynchospora pubera TaxID=906938 RepID=A0AAV8D245_9POAL|nr:E3 ubiquitin-protein ligase RBBP6 [Rhynchospora pubera]
MGISSENVNIDNFEDFGDEVYPTFDSPLDESDQNVRNLDNKHANNARYHHTNDGSDLSDAISKEIVGENCKGASDTEGENKKESKSKTKSEEYKKSTDGVTKCSSAMFNTDIPTELRCLLCKEIFKDAVMIPCCQHSFCDRCIRSTLSETRRCPKCSSGKCTVDDLLPNLSLRQAIERFIEAQASIGGMDNLPKDAPDGESGIQAIEASCAVSIRQQNFHSPSATGKGSNMAASESAQENKRNTGIKIRLDDKPLKVAAPTPVNTAPTNIGSSSHDKGTLSETAKHRAELHVGAHEPNFSRNLQENIEGNMPIQRRNDLAFSNQDGPGFFPQQQNRYNRRGDRTCYFCGSPSHFIRDCPSKFSGEAGFQGGASGYGPQVDWAGPAFNQYRPTFNMYGNPGVVPFDTGAYPVLPYQMPSYVPPFYPGMSDPYGFMRMGGMGPTMPAGAERPFVRPDYMDPRGGWYRGKSFGDHPERDDYEDRSDDYRYTENQRKPPQRRAHESDSESLEEPRSGHKKQSRSKYYSSDEEPRVNRKQPEKGSHSERDKDRRSHHSERSISEASSDRYSGRQHKGHQHRTSSRHHEESTLESRSAREGQGGSGKGKGVRERKVGSSSRDHGSEADRWEMGDGSEDDYRRERERHRQRRRRDH